MRAWCALLVNAWHSFSAACKRAVNDSLWGSVCVTLPLCANWLISQLILSVFNYLSSSGRGSEVQPAENKKRKTTIKDKQTDRQYRILVRARTNLSKSLLKDVGWGSGIVPPAHVSPSVPTRLRPSRLLSRGNKPLPLNVRWLRVQVSPRKDDARGSRATCEAAYVSFRIYGGPQGQSASVTSAKCWDERCWAVYDGAAQCGPGIGFHLANQMFLTKDWNGL